MKQEDEKKPDNSSVSYIAHDRFNVHLIQEKG